MIDPQAKAGPYIKLLALAGLLGVIAAIVTFIFMVLVNLGTQLLWEQAAPATGLPMPLLIVAICTLGGLLVGALVRIFGDYNGIFADVVKEFGVTGRFDYRNAPGIVLTALVSLVSSGSLGPEAPLADATGGIGTLLADKLKRNPLETRSLSYAGLSGMLGAFITSPVGGPLMALEGAQGGAAGLSLDFWILFPSIVSSAVGAVVFVALTESFFGTLYAFPEYVPKILDLFLAVPLGLIGGLVGMAFFIILRGSQKAFKPLSKHLIIRGIIGGLGLGVVAAFMPLILFSGKDQTVELINHAAEIGALNLVLLAVAKLLVTCFILAAGWKGGYLFPILFVGMALRLATNQLFPTIPVAVAVAATMGGVVVATFRAPLFAILFTLTLVQKETAPVIATAVVSGALLTAVLTLLISRRNAAPAQPAPEQPVAEAQ
ncbi:MAG: putative ion-transport protein YfeO [Anaerolineae bacterium]|nr:putative ion-transport protein YfeO [Anaerolineae bacterium]